MDSSQLSAYLERIGLDEAPQPTLQGLFALQLAHISHIPFENLDIIANRLPLRLDIDSLFDKLVMRKRGGICYEHNMLYAHVLEHLGFKVRRMTSHNPVTGKNEFDHMFLMVDFEDATGSTDAADSTDSLGESGTWITDVGYGFNMHAPIGFELGKWQSDGRDMLLLTQAKGSPAERSPELPEVVLSQPMFHLQRKPRTGETEYMYEFDLVDHPDEDYHARCHYFSTADDSFFRQGPIVSLDKPTGRFLLTKNHLRKFDEDGNPVMVDVPDEAAFRSILLEEFGIEF